MEDEDDDEDDGAGRFQRGILSGYSSVQACGVAAAGFAKDAGGQ